MNTTATVSEKGASAAKTAPSEREPVKLLKRIGTTTYKVAVHFSNDNDAEKLEDKILRMIEREVRESA
jgi:hypothetical protein